MKKLLALLLAMVMVLSLLAGCGDKSSSKKNNKDDDDDDKRGTITTSATDDTGSTGGTEATGGNNNAPTGGNNNASTGNNNAPTEGNNSVTPPSSTDKQFDTGSVKTNKYTNEFVGISLELGSEWTFLSDAEIEENNKQSLGMVGDNYKEMLESANTFTDMMATHSNQMDTISVGFEKLVGANASLTETQYIDLSKDALKGALESMGMTNVQVTSGTALFAGEQHAYVAVSAKFNGVAVYERMAVVKCPGYMITVTVCTWQTDSCKTILDTFKALSV